MISELWFDSFMEELFAKANKTYTIENGRAQYVNEANDWAWRLKGCDKGFPRHLYFSIEGYYLDIPMRDLIEYVRTPGLDFGFIDGEEV